MKNNEEHIRRTQLIAMSVGPLWLLRSRSVRSPATQSSEVGCCAVCGQPWVQSGARDSTTMVVLASSITDAAQQKLLEHCLAAAGWDTESTRFSLHANCVAGSEAVLPALHEQIAAQLPEHIIVFGHAASPFINAGLVAGQVNQYANTRLIVTHHPEEMMRNPALKAQVWADLCLVRCQP